MADGYQFLKLALDAIALLLSIGAWVYAWTVKRSQARHAEIEKLQKAIEEERGRRRHDVEDIVARLTRAETKLDDAPSARATHELALAISGLSGDLKATVSELRGLSDVVQRIDTVVQRQEEYLLNQAGKR